MKTIYTLTTSMMNGTIVMASQSTSYVSKELAEKAKKAVEDANEGSPFPVVSSIEESSLYESESEIPILNGMG